MLLGVCFAFGLALGALLLWLWGPAQAPRPAQAPAPASQPANVAANSQGAPANQAPGNGQAYEEPVSHELLLVDSAIYNGLAKAGISHQQSKLWMDLTPQGETSRLEVNLSPSQEITQVAAALERALHATKARFVWQKQENFWHLEVFVDGALTHQVNLRKKAPPPPPPPGVKPRAAIIVDDVGLNQAALNQLLALKMELTFSVLPYAPGASQVARKILGQNHELWLHLPMEPLGGISPGPDALLVSMSRNELERLTAEAIARVPGAVGVNNHMGSKLTQNALALAGPMQVIKSHNLLFIDSVTSPKSVAEAVAKETGIMSGRRDIFLDHEVREEAIARQIEKLINLAKAKGFAIAICHPHPATIAALKQMQARLGQSLELVPASQLVRIQ